MDHRILERHLLVIERRAEVLLSDKLVPFTLGMQVLVEETERSHVAVGKLAQLLLDVSLVVWQSAQFARLKVSNDSLSCLIHLVVGDIWLYWAASNRV